MLYHKKCSLALPHVYCPFRFKQDDAIKCKMLPTEGAINPHPCSYEDCPFTTYLQGWWGKGENDMIHHKIEYFLTQSAHAVMEKLEEIAKKEGIGFTSLVLCFLNLIQAGISNENAIRLLSGVPMRIEEKEDLFALEKETS